MELDLCTQPALGPIQTPWQGPPDCQKCDTYTLALARSSLMDYERWLNGQNRFPSFELFEQRREDPDRNIDYESNYFGASRPKGSRYC